MSLVLRLSLLTLLIAGCASQLVTVPESDWQQVPATQRDAVDRQLAADHATARAEITAATASLDAMQRSQPPPVAASRTATAPRTPTAPTPAAGGDEWAKTMHAQEQARAEATAKVEAAKAAWQRADLTWRKLRLDAANARIEVLVCERELVRAQTIDRSLPGTDTYNVAPLRGQFSQVQKRWYGVASNARQARAAFEQASANLSAAKEAYADLMRGGPRPSTPSVAAADPVPLLLPGWALSRSDTRRRRGLRHFLDAGASPQLRGVAIQLKVTSRTAQAISLGMTPPAADTPSTIDRPAIKVPQPNAPAPAKPADRAVPPTSPAPGVASNVKPAAGALQPNTPAAGAKPADRAVAPTSPAAGVSVNNKPAPGAPQTNAPVAAKPANRAVSTASPAPGVSINNKPAAGAPQPNAPAASKPADRAAPTTSPAAGAPVNNKPAAGAPQPSAPAAATKPAAGPLFSTSSAGASGNAKPATGATQGNAPTVAPKAPDRPLFPTSSDSTSSNAKPPAGASPGSAPAAKPADRPVSQPDAPKR